MKIRKTYGCENTATKKVKEFKALAIERKATLVVYGINKSQARSKA